MTDVNETPEAVTEETAAEATATETPEEEKPKTAKAAKEPHACFCQGFEVADPQDADSVFTTGCEQTTKSMFAQGHDARLVSFLVDGHFDGYQIRHYADGAYTVYPTPADAAALASEPLRAKAEKATENRQAKLDAKAQATAEREAKKAAKAQEKADAKAAKEAEKAEKANAPKATGAEVVAGSAEGDQTPLAEGEVKIKVGRWEYNATIDDEGNAHYVDGSGEEQVRAPGVFQVLAAAGI